MLLWKRSFTLSRTSWNHSSPLATLEDPWIWTCLPTTLKINTKHDRNPRVLWSILKLGLSSVTEPHWKTGDTSTVMILLTISWLWNLERSCLELSFILTCQGFEPTILDPTDQKNTEGKRKQLCKKTLTFFLTTMRPTKIKISTKYDSISVFLLRKNMGLFWEGYIKRLPTTVSVSPKIASPDV